MWRDRVIEQTVAGTSELASPIWLTKVLWFGTLFIAIHIAGTLLTRRFGSYGMLATGAFGGLVSSASTTAAAATLAMHGNISPALAGSTTVLASLSRAAVNLPIVWRTAKNKAVVRRLSVEVFPVVAMGLELRCSSG
jgi:uncharacterized membrane protein (DUF4010 family)